MITQTYLIYDIETGLVRGRCGTTAGNAGVVVPAGRALLAVNPEESEAATEFDYTAFYVHQGQAYRRREPDIYMSDPILEADGLSELVITGIPENSKLLITGVVQAGPTIVTGGSLTLTSTKKGEIKISLDCPAPYAKWEGTVYAT